MPARLPQDKILEGFATVCASKGIDPANLLKVAQILPPQNPPNPPNLPNLPNLPKPLNPPPTTVKQLLMSKLRPHRPALKSFGNSLGVEVDANGLKAAPGSTLARVQAGRQRASSTVSSGDAIINTPAMRKAREESGRVIRKYPDIGPLSRELVKARYNIPAYFKDRTGISAMQGAATRLGEVYRTNRRLLDPAWAKKYDAYLADEKYRKQTKRSRKRRARLDKKLLQGNRNAILADKQRALAYTKGMLAAQAAAAEKGESFDAHAYRKKFPRPIRSSMLSFTRNKARKKPLKTKRYRSWDMVPGAVNQVAGADV